MLIRYESTAGLTTVGYRILNADKTEYAALTTTGVTEVSPGGYGVTVADSVLAGRTVEWYEGATYSVAESFPSIVGATVSGGNVYANTQAMANDVVTAAAIADNAAVEISNKVWSKDTLEGGLPPAYNDNTTLGVLWNGYDYAALAGNNSQEIKLMLDTEITQIISEISATRSDVANYNSNVVGNNEGINTTNITVADILNWLKTEKTTAVNSTSGPAWRTEESTQYDWNT